MTDLLIFGTGAVSDMILEHYLDLSKARIVAFINSTQNGTEKKGYKVISENEIFEYRYDYILIAANAFDIISEQLIAAGVPEEKIIGITPQSSRKLKQIFTRMNAEIEKNFNIDIAMQFLKKRLPGFDVFSYSISNRIVLDTQQPGQGGLEFSYSKPDMIDSIRAHTLCGLAKEIEMNDVKGNVAELGVYKGDFACIINQLFPNRKLYLFDTFQGFTDSDKQVDKANNFSNSSSLFADTSVELVLSKMQYRDKCEIVKGSFPGSAEHFDDIFSFVSIDADLFSPIYCGLTYFYERLSNGGYLLIHDFYNKYYSGVQEAVKRFCREKVIGYVPIPYYNGSVIIAR